MYVSPWAQEIWNKVKYPVKKQTIDLVKITVGELFDDTNIHTTKEIYAKAKKMGLDLCPPQVGPQLRFDYKDQPEGEWLTVAMKPIADSDGGPSVFDVGRFGDDLRLDDRWTRPDNEWDPGNRFVFSVRKSLDSLTLRPLRSQKVKVTDSRGLNIDDRFGLELKHYSSKNHIADVGKKVLITKTYTLNGTFTEEELKELIK